MEMTSFRIGVIGDLHTHWDDVDVAQFAGSNYDLLFFVGDLGGGTPESTLRVARTIARLNRPALVMPGNNDTGDMSALAAELSHRAGLNRLNAMRTGSAERPPIQPCGYSTHRFVRDSLDVTLLAARPHSMGGPELSFPEYMAGNYGIGSLADSTGRLCALIDGIESQSVVIFSHNGPTGFGSEPHAMWGCDFKPGGGDWGDPDLAAAIQYARQRGKRVLAVLAGHMHLRTKQGAQRPWLHERDGTAYVNTARVPRIFASNNEVLRHHVSLAITVEGVKVSEVFVSG